MTPVFNLADQKFLRTLGNAMKFFIVEYSLKEDATSIRTLEVVLRDNYKKIGNGVSKDYLAVGIFKSHDDALRWSLHFQNEITPQAQLESGSRNWKQIANYLESELDNLIRSASPYAESSAAEK